MLARSVAKNDHKLPSSLPIPDIILGIISVLSYILHPNQIAVWYTGESLAMVGYPSDLASTLFFLHDHPCYFTTANALMAGGHNHTIFTLAPTILCRSVLFGTR